MRKGFWIWLVLALGLITGGCYLASGDLWIYLDLASFVLTVVLSILLGFTSNSPREIAGYIRQARVDTGLDAEQARRGIVYFRYIQRTIIILGILCTFIGIVAMMRNLGDEKSLGKGFSTAIITTLYSLVFSVVFTQPFITALEKKLAAPAGK